MPIYDFACSQCGKQFDLLIAAADKDKVKCPDCGSSQIKQLLSPFSTSKARDITSMPVCCNAQCRGCSMNS